MSVLNKAQEISNVLREKIKEENKKEGEVKRIIENKERMSETTQTQIKKILEILKKKSNNMTNKKYKDFYEEFNKQLLNKAENKNGKNNDGKNKGKQFIDSLYLIKLMNITYYSIVKNCKGIDISKLKIINNTLKVTLKNNSNSLKNLDESKCTTKKGKDSIKLFKLCFNYLFRGKKNNNKQEIEKILKKKSSSIMNQKYKRELKKYKTNEGSTDAFYLSLMGIAKESAIRNCGGSNIKREVFMFMKEINVPTIDVNFEDLKNKCNSKKGKDSIELYKLCYEFLSDKKFRLINRNIYTNEERQKLNNFKNDAKKEKLIEQIYEMIEENFNISNSNSKKFAIKQYIQKESVNETTVEKWNGLIKNIKNRKLKKEQELEILDILLKNPNSNIETVISKIVNREKHLKENKSRLQNIFTQDDIVIFFKKLKDYTTKVIKKWKQFYYIF